MSDIRNNVPCSDCSYSTFRLEAEKLVEILHGKKIPPLIAPRGRSVASKITLLNRQRSRGAARQLEFSVAELVCMSIVPRLLKHELKYEF